MSRKTPTPAEDDLSKMVKTVLDGYFDGGFTPQNREKCAAAALEYARTRGWTPPAARAGEKGGPAWLRAALAAEPSARVELCYLGAGIVSCVLYGFDGRVLGRGAASNEEEARELAAVDFARREAVLDGALS